MSNNNSLFALNFKSLINSYDKDFMIKAMKIEKIGMQRTRAANIGVWKTAVDVYNITHDDSKLELSNDGIVKVKMNAKK